MISPKTTPPADVLALRPRDAARALGISERCLWSLTQRGEVPHVKIGGRLVLYPRAALVDWLERAAKQPPFKPTEEVAHG